MKKLLFLLVIILAFTSINCAGNSSIKDSLPTNDVIVSDKTYDILFDYDFVDSIIYLEDDNCCVIRYNDPDCFDYDCLATLTNRYKWYGEFISIDIEEEILVDFIYDYHLWKDAKNHNQREKYNDKYIIIEHDLTYSNGDKDIIFYIGLNEDI